MSNEPSYIPNAEVLRDCVERIYRISPDREVERDAYLSLSTGCFRLGFNLAKRGHTTDGKECINYPSNLLRGCASKAVVVQELRQQEQYTVVFKPYGLSRFTKIPLQDLAHEELSAADVFGDGVLELSEKLQETPNSARNFELIELFLLEQCVSADTRMVKEAFGLIRNGVYNVTQICEMVHCEERTLRRHFAKFTGVSIKEQIRLVRLSKVWKDLTNNLEKKSFDIAFDHGFTDQAHFNNELKKLTGLTPSEVRRSRIADHYQFEVLSS